MINDFDMDDFKKWIKERRSVDEPRPVLSKHALIGLEVCSRVGLNKLTEKVEAQSGDTDEMCKDFLQEGGMIIDVTGKKFLVEVTSGTFYVHRMYTKKANQ